MRKILNVCSLLALLIVALPFVFTTVKPMLEGTLSEAYTEALEQKTPLQDRIDLAWQQEFERTQDPALGIVPRERLKLASIHQRNLFSAVSLGKAAIAGITWQERGPNNCGGRTRALLVDMSDATKKTIWAGGAGGGLWKTTNISLLNPTWTPVNDFFQNLAITSISQAPANSQVMYFCTGEGSGNMDAIRGLGVWKSANNGITWTQLLSTNNASFYYCQKVFTLSNGDTVFVATKSGLFRSVNAGNTFTKVLGTGISSTTGNICYDIEMMNNGTLYTTMSGGISGSIHKSYNTGATWSAPLTVPGYVNMNQMEIAVAGNDSNVIYALVEYNSKISAIIKSTNAGVSWDTIASHPIDADGGVSVAGINYKDFSRGQAWYDLSLAVDPNNVNVCVVGGVDLFKTGNGGNTWTQLSHWYGGFGYQEVHADQHLAYFEPGSSLVCYFTNDGGIYRSTNMNGSSPAIITKGNNYNTTQFYACDIHPLAGANQFVAGAQDNGSHSFNTAGINATTQVTGGDGAFCHIDQDQPNFWFTSYVYTSYYRSSNSGGSFSNVLNVSGNVGSFISPTDYDDAANKMYMCGNNGTYQRWDNPQTGNSVSTETVGVFNSGKITHVKVSPNNTNRVYFGTNGGRVIRVDNANSSSHIDSFLNNGKGMPTGSVSCIEVETGNDDHLLTTYSNYGVTSIWESKNGGFTWTGVEGNLPDMPVRWALFNPNKSWQVMIATELGIWTTDSLRGFATDWQPSNNGFANVRTDMLKMRASDKQVVAATHGRGLFTSNIFSPPFADFSANRTLVYISQPINFISTSNGASSYNWNFGDGSFSSAQNPVKQYLIAGFYNVTLTINGGAYTKTINSFIHVLPYRAVPYTLAAGGNFETNPDDFGGEVISGTGFVRGSSTTTGKSGTASGSFAWVTGITGNYADNSEVRLYSPSFNCTASGAYTLRFKVKNRFEISYDGYIVEYSINAGNTWTKLGSSVLSSWYDFANTVGVTAFPVTEPFFNATRSTYTQMQYVFSSLAGNSKVCFRVVFKSDNGTVDVGMAIDDFEIIGPTNAALPATLLNFMAQRIGVDQVQLYWTTASEQNNKGFEIERSDDGINFNVLSFKAGKVNSNTTQQYVFTDTNAEQDHLYYRLKQMDLNGAYEYSQIITVGSHQIDKRLVNVMQVSGLKSLFIETQLTQLTARLLNQSGQQLQQFLLNRGKHIYAFENIAAGIYLLEISDEKGNKQVEKILLME
ncbi:MAG: hypothetical protein H7296_09855 [Bacteroidia bacterium]|nr:hypothetical protein [Bacteroidia bacterium]